MGVNYGDTGSRSYLLQDISYFLPGKFETNLKIQKQNQI